MCVTLLYREARCRGGRKYHSLLQAATVKQDILRKGFTDLLKFIKIMQNGVSFSGKYAIMYTTEKVNFLTKWAN